MLSSLEFVELPQPQKPLLLPFFHCSLPLVAPGINASYMPAIDRNNKLTIIHTPIARAFLEAVLWHLRDQSNIISVDTRIMQAISHSTVKVPLEVHITLHLKTLWQKDIDGPDKIILDALFTHFQFLAEPGQEKNWNDNRVVRLHVEKDVSASGQASIEIQVFCAISGK